MTPDITSLTAGFVCFAGLYFIIGLNLICGFGFDNCTDSQRRLRHLMVVIILIFWGPILIGLALYGILYVIYHGFKYFLTLQILLDMTDVSEQDHIKIVENADRVSKETRDIIYLNKK